MMKNVARSVSIGADLAKRLREKPVVGEGGFQSLMRKLQKQLEGDILQLDDTDLERIEHYAFDFGGGGWQLLLREVVAAVENAAHS